MAGSTGKQLNQRLNLTVNTAQARQQLQSLYTQLNSITKGTNLSNGLGITNELLEANKAAAQLKVTLAEALNPNTGNLNLTAFSDQLRMQNMSLEKYRQQLSNLGSVGDKAFTSLAKSIVTAEAPITRLGKWGQELTTTLGNTVRWQLTSSLLHGVMSTASQAMNYVKNLDSSLNSIRIVTGQSDEQMQRFARTANEAAKALNTTTNAYAQASLIYYQQGLSDKQVQERTAATIKLANVSGQTASKVSDQLTAIWNNFYDGSKSLEYYIDVMTALGASTASSTDEISKGLEKFASIARTTGLSYEYATSALSTVVAATRQSADSVGTSFKTLFSRLQGLSLGETLDDGTTLNKYSKALNTIGVNIKNANGSLKDMDNILNDIGDRWTSLSKAEQVALAQTVGGARNYTGLISLMDNWDDFQKNLQTAQQAQGTLQRQADIYSESWEAASKHVRAASETIYKNLLDDKFFKGLTNGFGDILDIIGAATNSLGGFKGVMSTITGFATTHFAPKVSAGLQDIGLTITGFLPGGRARVENIRTQAIEELLKPTSNFGTPLGAVEHQYRENLATRSDAYRTAAKSGRLQSWQQPIYQQLMSGIAQQEDRALAAYERSELLDREGDNYSRLLQRQTNTYLASHPTQMPQKGYNTGTVPSPGSHTPALGTMRQLYAAHLTNATANQYISRLDYALNPFTNALSQGNNAISLNNIQQFMGVVQGISEIAGKTGINVSELLNLGSDDHNINNIFGSLLQQYQAHGGQITESNRQIFQNIISANHGDLTQAIDSVIGNFSGTRQDFRNIIEQIYGTDSHEGRQIISDFDRMVQERAEATADREFQDQNAKRANSQFMNMLRGDTQKGISSMSQMLTTTTSLATSAGAAYLQFANATKLIGDETATTTDRIGAFVSAGMTLPMLGHSVSNFAKSFSNDFQILNHSMGISTGIAGLITTALVGVGVAAHAAYRDLYLPTTWQGQVKQMQEYAVASKQTAASAQESYDQFEAAFTNQAKLLNEARNSEYGTVENTQARARNNENAIALIDKYGLTTDQWSIDNQGNINIKSDVYQQIQEGLLNDLETANTSALMSSQMVNLEDTLGQYQALTADNKIYASHISGSENGYISYNELYNGYQQALQNNPNLTLDQYWRQIGAWGYGATREEYNKEDYGNGFWNQIKGRAGYAWASVANLFTNTQGRQMRLDLGLSEWASDEEVLEALGKLDSTTANQQEYLAAYVQNLATSVQSSQEVDKDLKELVALQYGQELSDQEIDKLVNGRYIETTYSKDEEKYKKGLIEEYIKKLEPTDIDSIKEYTIDQLEVGIRNWHIEKEIQEQINARYQNMEQYDKSLYAGYNIKNRQQISSLVYENTDNPWVQLIKQKQAQADTFLYQALMAQMPINSFSSDLNKFQDWLAQQNMSIQTQQQLENYIIDFGTTFGSETVKWLYDNVNDAGFQKDFQEVLSGIDLTGNTIQNLYNIRQQANKYADTGTEKSIRKNLNTLYEKAIKDIGGDAGLVTSLLSNTDFSSILDKLITNFQQTGELTASTIQAASAKSEVLSQFLSSTENVNAGGLATVIREISNGNLSANQITNPLLRAFSTAADPETRRASTIASLGNYEYADSLVSAFSGFFKDTKKAISPGWYGGTFYDAPIQQFLGQMSLSTQEKYKANVTRALENKWSPKQFQNQIKSDMPDLYSYIGKITSKSGADEYDMFDFMYSEGDFNGPVSYDPKTGMISYDDEWFNNPENADQASEYGEWLFTHGYEDLVDPETHMPLGTKIGQTQRGSQAAFQYQLQRNGKSTEESARQAETVMTHVHDQGVGIEWDQNAARFAAEELAVEDFKTENDVKAFFEANLGNLGYKNTAEDYQRFLKDFGFVTTKSTIPAGGRSITTEQRHMVDSQTLSELGSEATRQKIESALGDKAIEDYLASQGIEKNEETGAYDYSSAKIAFEQLGLSQDAIASIMDEMAETGTLFSASVRDANGAYKEIFSSDGGIAGLKQGMEDAEKYTNDYFANQQLIQSMMDADTRRQITTLRAQGASDEDLAGIVGMLSTEGREQYEQDENQRKLDILKDKFHLSEREIIERRRSGNSLDAIITQEEEKAAQQAEQEAAEAAKQQEADLLATQDYTDEEIQAIQANKEKYSLDLETAKAFTNSGATNYAAWEKAGKPTEWTPDLEKKYGNSEVEQPEVEQSEAEQVAKTEAALRYENELDDTAAKAAEAQQIQQQQQAALESSKEAWASPEFTIADLEGMLYSGNLTPEERETLQAEITKRQTANATDAGVKESSAYAAGNKEQVAAEQAAAEEAKRQAAEQAAAEAKAAEEAAYLAGLSGQQLETAYLNGEITEEQFQTEAYRRAMTPTVQPATPIEGVVGEKASSKVTAKEEETEKEPTTKEMRDFLKENGYTNASINTAMREEGIGLKDLYEQVNNNLKENNKYAKKTAEGVEEVSDNTGKMAEAGEEATEKEITDKAIGKDAGKKEKDKDKDLFGNTGGSTGGEGGGDSDSGGDDSGGGYTGSGSAKDAAKNSTKDILGKIEKVFEKISGKDFSGKGGSSSGGSGFDKGASKSSSKITGGTGIDEIKVKFVAVASGQNNARLLAYASGKEGHIAVTGELGPELRVKSDGSMDVLGKTGREYAWVEPNDRIYTASQSAGILKSNKIPELEGLAKGINNYIPGYGEGAWNTLGRPDGSSSGGGGGGGGRGGGGGAAEEIDPRYDPNTLKIRDVLERYYTILQKIDDITRAVERFAKVADRAWGQDRIKAIEKQTDLYQKQYDAQKQYVQQIGEYMNTDKNALTTMIREFVEGWNKSVDENLDPNKTIEKISWMGASFDSNGVLTNYRDFVEKLVEQYNSGVAAGSIDQNAQYKFQEQLKDIQMYTDTLNLWESETDKLQELANQILDNSLKEITYRVEYELELNADQKRLLDFRDSFVKDDIFKVAEHISNMNDEIANTADSLEKTRKGLYDYLGTLAGENMRLGETYDDVALGIAIRDEQGLVSEKNYKDIDFKAVSNNLDKWLAELRQKDSKSAKKVDEIIQRDTNGIITNYRDVLNKINEMNEQLSNSSINLLLSDAQTFFNQISDLTNNPKWTGLSTEMKDQITNYMDQFIQYIQSMGEEFKDIIESMGDSIKAFGKKMDNEIDEFDYYGDVYKSFGNIIDLTNQKMTDITSDFFKTLNSKVLDNNINKIEAARRRYELFTNTLAQVQAQYNAMVDRMNAAQGVEERAFYQQRVDELKEQLDIANSQMENAHKEFLQSWEDALSKIQENYKDAVEQASKEFEKGFSPLFNTLALLQAQFDREKALGDLYVDNYQRIHDLNKLNRDIDQSILDTDNLKSKQKLRDLQQEIKDLQEDGTELSEYDLDILDKKYKLELARQALEDAKDAKSIVRLSRDNNGNWGYVYTADEDEIAEAEQNYEDAIRDMEQANQDYIDNIQDQIINVQQEAQQAILALQPEDFATYDDYLAAVQNIQDAMYQTLNFLRSQMNNAFDNNDWLENYVPGIVRDHGLTDNFGDTTLAGLLLNNDLDNAIERAKENLQDNLITPALEAFTTYSEKQKEVYEVAGHNMATIGQEFGKEMETLTKQSEEQVNVVMKLADRVEDSFGDTMDAVIQATNDWLDNIKEVVKEYDILLERITELKKIDGEYVEPAKMINGDNAVDTWEELDRFQNELSANGTLNLVTTDATTGKEKVTKYIAGTQMTNDFIYQATVGAAKKDIIDIGEDGVDETEDANVRQYLKAHGLVWVKYKDDTGEHELMFTSEEEWAAWYENHKYIAPVEESGGGNTPWTTGGWTKDQLSHFSGGYIDTGGYTGRWQSADTGMYTGEWPSGSVRRNGRLAWLHQKELVLNAHDTENFLDAMEIVRQLDNLTNWMANGLGDLMMPRVTAESGELEQNVHIEAEFPNVTDHSEIEQAFSNLVNMASQYANRK